MADPADLDELDRLRAAATQGEWRAPAKVNIAVHADDCAIYVNRPVGDEAPETRARWDADARWIATAHNAYPAMAAELRELRRIVAATIVNDADGAPCYRTANGIPQTMPPSIERTVRSARKAMQTRGPK